MLPELFQSVLAWVSAHPGMAGLVVFLIAMGESLAVVGIILPGAVLLFAFGALAATGTVPLLQTLLAASLGAIAGDAMSFWLGRLLQDRLHSVWPFSTHPEWIERGVAYFRRHGGKSIVLGRFVGPLRAVIPATAGMLGMSPTRFFMIDVVSAFAWSPIYLFPGMVFGYSLELASRVAIRLALLLALAAALLWLTLLLARGLYRWTAPHLEDWLQNVLNWSVQHPMLGQLGAAIVDPTHRESGGLAILGATLLLTTAIFLMLVVLAVGGTLPGGIDAAVFHFFKALQTPWGDAAMLRISSLGDYPALTAVGAVVLLWLAWRSAWAAALHWIAAIAFGVLAAWIIRAVLDLPLPPGVAPTVGEGFPSAHGVVSTIALGFTAILVARETPSTWRWAPYAIATLGVTSVLVARLYLGIHWLSDGIAGVSLGVAWTALIGIAFQRHGSRTVGSLGLASVASLALIGATLWSPTRPVSGPAPSAPTPRVLELAEERWWETDWQLLPARRIDLGGPNQEPMVIQWAADRRSLEAALTEGGFVTPRTFGFDSLLLPLNTDGGLDERPLLPRAHQGRHEDLAMVRYDPGNDERWVARFWHSGYQTEAGLPIWLSQFSRQRLGSPTVLFSLVEERPATGASLLQFLSPSVDSRAPSNAEPPRLLIRAPREVAQ